MSNSELVQMAVVKVLVVACYGSDNYTLIILTVGKAGHQVEPTKGRSNSKVSETSAIAFAYLLVTRR